MALPLYGWSGRWRSLYLGLHRMRTLVGHPLYGFGVYHRSSWCFQYGTCLYQARQWNGLEVGRLPGGAHGLPDYRLLCGGFGLVPAVCVCQHHGRTAWRPNLRGELLQGVFCRSYSSGDVDGGNLPDLSLRDYPWCTRRNREGIQGDDAASVHPASHHRGVFLSVAGCGKGYRVPAEA